MTLPPDWWTTDLDDEPCRGCGVSPSKHQGHGAYICKACYESCWCPECKYQLTEGHVCPTPEQREADEREYQRFMKEIGL